ncbi:acetylornithine deacetylase [Aestuariibacter sp. AA17]|uniref:Acetylornithine deacetylase n=1 Tax=Fluctibacter corallii TaxID=2984329 RepID=A0ABT3A6T8_9ALTE|nr:acetylornithine deacetylase [Aestuariibacter sp. AA17]MCV2884391.1 acetylornithine deacetylase [Aestuariibacter sp. AA17]
MKNLSFIDLYKRIIAVPSISSEKEYLDQSNLAIIDLLSQQFAEYGFNISIQKVPETRSKYNMLARIGTGEGGLLLSGHSDTVPFDEGKWLQDPFMLRHADNRLYGLGACDMKGFFAFILEALKTVPLHQLKKPLYILATADEETSMAGARFFSEQQLIKPDMAIIGEPTELKPIAKHKGHIAHSLSVTGQAGHSSDPAKGVNAIEIMHKAIGALIDLKQQLEHAEQDTDFTVSHTTLNLGHIHGGDGENRICGHCQLNFDMRAVPVVEDEDAILRVDDALKGVVEHYPGRIERRLMYPTAPAFACKNEYGIIELAESLTGFSATSANYATEGPFINRLGCDTLILGPGSITQAHQPNEYISLSYVDPTVTLLQKMIKRVCF